MIFCIFRRSDGLFLRGALNHFPPHDPLAHVVITRGQYPNPRTERWDRAEGIRPATAQEMTDFDAAQHIQETAAQEQKVLRQLDTANVIKALALVLLDEINVLRTKAGLIERTPAQLRDAVMAKFKTLNG